MGATAEKEWFYLSLGHRRGPVSREDVCDMIAKQEVYIDSTQVWKHGMTQWVDLADAKPFAAPIKKIRAAAAQVDARVRETSSSTGVDEDLVCRGSTRALFNLFFYVGWVVPLFVGVVLLAELQVHQLVTVRTVRSSIWLQSIPVLLFAIALWQMAATRMRHAGYSPKHGLGVFVPIYNVWVLFICMFAPRNYMRKKKLGKPAFCYALFFIAVATSLTLGVIPGLNLKTLSPIAVNESLTNFYKEKASVVSRTNYNSAKAAQIKANSQGKQKAADKKQPQRSFDRQK